MTNLQIKPLEADNMLSGWTQNETLHLAGNILTEGNWHETLGRVLNHVSILLCYLTLSPL